MLHMCRALCVLLMISLVITQASAAEGPLKAGDITVASPWSRATPEGAKVAAGYLTITNDRTAADRLVSATAEIAGRVSIHEMRMEGEMMRMRDLPEGLSLPAGATVSLAPNGTHLMFLDLRRTLKKGDSFAGTLIFERAGTIHVTFTVEALGAASPEDTGRHHHHHH
jgi:copper(I)-binding protein